MTTSKRRAREQLEQFLSALFLPDELIELRFIECWVSQGKKTSRVVRAAEWLPPGGFLSAHEKLNASAQRTRANIYFGVCPRANAGDADDQAIKTVRCIWCDIDQVTTDEADRRWNAASVPAPSMVVRSGSGVHGYWLLDRDLTSHEDRSRLAGLLQNLYRSFGGDHVQNPSRVLRPPGTMNYKDARNGRKPLPCTLHTFSPEVRFPLDAFAPWMQTQQKAQAEPAGAAAVPSKPRSFTGRRFRQRSKIAELVNRLLLPSPDRSRRDFAIVCELLRLGLSHDEIWSLVSTTSKFESSGRPYFDLTIANAEKIVLVERADVG